MTPLQFILYERIFEPLLRKSTPLKSAESTLPTLLINRKGASSELAHITPIKHTSLTEPWTPTANLKMLISAASPDIRDREMKKVLFRPIENDKDQPASPDNVVEDPEVEDSCQFEAADEEDDAEKKPSRKQKSLGLLCQKFLALYPDYPPLHSPIWISLDEVAANLGVERRRIYDIVNVLESLTIVGRIAKNSYTWYGRQRLEATLEELQREGRQQGYHLQMDSSFLHCPFLLLVFAAGSNRKDKSLRIMSQKFVMLFLVSKTQTVTLDAAAKVLIEENSRKHLIKKVHVREERGRKPAFKWLGPVEFSSSVNAGEKRKRNPSNLLIGLLSSFLGLNGLNFLLSAGQPAASLALPPSSVPTLALPYVLVPSAALSHYPLVAGSLQQQGSDAHTKLSFGLPAMMSPAHFMVGGAPYSVVPVPPPSTPEQSGLYRSSTPHTPKETPASSSKAFFQTPGTLGSVVSAAPAVRKRGSAQRRLDIGHHPTS
uniref:Transcription factor E2F7 n=1 Tax=Pundamilia nyererei TaxID=303518 RepID=A0A3B4H4M3_9CICH